MPVIAICIFLILNPTECKIQFISTQSEIQSKGMQSALQCYYINYQHCLVRFESFYHYQRTLSQKMFPDHLPPKWLLNLEPETWPYNLNFLTNWFDKDINDCVLNDDPECVIKDGYTKDLGVVITFIILLLLILNLLKDQNFRDVKLQFMYHKTEQNNQTT